MIIRLLRLGWFRACLVPFATVIALATTSCTPKPQPPAGSLRNNLVVEPRSADAASDLRRLVIEVRAKDLKEPFQAEVRAADTGGLKGALNVSPGSAREFRVKGYDADGTLTHEGSIVADVRREGPMSIAVALNPRTERGEPVILNLASYSIQLDSKPDPAGGYAVQARAFDPDGNPAHLTPDDYTWGTHGPAWYGHRPFGDKPGNGIHFPPPPPPPGDNQIVRLCAPSDAVTACVTADICRSVHVCADPVVQVSAGGSHTCALTKGGIVRCWGDNSDGQLGLPTSPGCGASSAVSCQPMPTAVVCPAGSPCRFTEISAGASHTCAIDTAKKVWCWGSNLHQQLGAASAAGGKFVHVSSVANAVHIAAGDEFTCALTVPPNGQKQVWCWGANDKGQTGTPLVAHCTVSNIDFSTQCEPVQDVAVPKQVIAFPPSKMIVAGSRHACAVTTDGFMRCWGDNNRGQVANLQMITVAPLTADPTSTGQPLLQNCSTCTIAPVTVFGALVSGANGSPLDVAGAGGETTCASLTGSSSACWGRNPVSYPFGVAVTSIDAGATHACAVTSIGTQCWGEGNSGQLGDGRSSSLGGINAPAPVNVITNATYTQVSAGRTHSCALTTDGLVQCWGRNAEGQLGTGSFVTVIATPVPSLL